MQALDPARLEPLFGPERMAGFEAVVEQAQQALAGRIVWNVISTAVGGGVAEMLQTFLAYARGGGVDARWLVIEGDPAFFAITKRIHYGLYGSLGDGGALGGGERLDHQERCAATRRRSERSFGSGISCFCTTPRRRGLRQRCGARARSSSGAATWGATSRTMDRRAWAFLRPYLEDIDASVFSRASFAPPWVDPDRTTPPPSIDPFSAKNEPMSHRNVQLALAYAGLLDGEAAAVVPFTRRDGSPGRINRHVDVVQSGPAAPADAPLVLQAPAGIDEGHGRRDEGLRRARRAPARRAPVLAGPAVTGVADDPEAAEVYDDCIARWRALPHAARGRVDLACAPMADPDEAAAIVTRCSAAPQSSGRRASPRASGSPWPRRCGSHARSLRARSVASSTRSTAERTAC